MLSLFLALSAPHVPAPSAAAGELVAVRAGTIHLVKDGAVLEGDAVLLVKDGRVLSSGVGIDVPPNARVVDYGPGAVVVPGFVAASSPHAISRWPSERGVDPALLAVDGFDFYDLHAWDLAAGVTSVYVTPGQGRLIAGQGAVVKLGEGARDERVLRAPAALHGSIASEARNTPPYWKPPIPATVDVGMGQGEPQRPASTMGGVQALRELYAAARAGDALEGYGPNAVRDLAAVLRANVPWRIRAENEAQVRALVRFASENQIPLLVELIGGPDLTQKAIAELAEAGVGAIVELPFVPNRGGRDLGSSADSRWPVYDLASRLQQGGVRVAFSTPDTPRHLRFAAAVGSRGGMDPAAALRAITLTPAELLGVSDRVGSLAPGMDADFVVLNGPPLSGASIEATWVRGEPRWTWAASGARAASSHRSSPRAATVLSVDELHVGDGEVLSPGEILMVDGRIAEIGRSVSRPGGATVVHGAAAMPGMIDALGHLGLEGTRDVPSTDFEMGRIVAIGDTIDRRVAAAGVTTVVMSPRRPSRSGAPVLAYKPATASFEHAVIEDPAALRLEWAQSDRLESGKAVRDLLQKAAEYAKEWRDYEQAMKTWTPPPVLPAAAAAEDEKDEKADEEKKEEAKDEEKAKEGDDGKKKKKKKGEEEIDPDPVTGIWTASVTRPPMSEPVPLRMQIRMTDGKVEGSLRSAAVSEGLVQVQGTYERLEESGQHLVIGGLGSQGYFTLDGVIAGDELTAKLKMGTAQVDVTAKRESRDYPVAKKKEWVPEEKKKDEEKEKPPKGMPKEPRRDAKLEPLRRAIEGGGVAVIVDVERRDEILACVDAFEAVGIRPVLNGAEDALEVAGRIRGRIAGVLLSNQVVEPVPKRGTDLKNRYAELQLAGIPVAFHSEAEEGAADLPLMAAYAVSEGMSTTGALRALTSDAAAMMGIDHSVGRIARGLDADVLLLDGSPLSPSTRVVRAWVNGVEIP